MVVSPNGGSISVGKRNSATPFLTQFNPLFTSILPHFNLFLTSFLPNFYLNLTSAQPAISNNGLETTVYYEARNDYTDNSGTAQASE